jgi:hypothetical protein
MMGSLTVLVQQLKPSDNKDALGPAIAGLIVVLVMLCLIACWLGWIRL